MNSQSFKPFEMVMGKLGKSSRGQQAIGASLMLRAYPRHLQHLSQLVEPAVKVVTKFHEVLDVIHGSEVDLQGQRAAKLCIEPRHPQISRAAA